MKKGLVLLMLLCSILICAGQGSIKGKVLDGQQALPFATVVLRGSDSSLVKGAVTNTEGQYLFENVSRGLYFIEATTIGYAKFNSGAVAVEGLDITMPDFILSEMSVALGEVVVKADKPLFEHQMDRVVMNVQSSITSAGNTALELLQKSPGVVVNKQNSTISMSGKSGVWVMINNKMMQLPAEVVVQMLDGMNASNIEKIELITTPPSKYDAEGNAGIIHIVTKRNADLGTNASFALTLGAHAAETTGASFNISHRGNNVACFVDYGIVRNRNLHRATLISESFDDDFLSSVSDVSHRENVTTQQNLSTGFEWRPTGNTTLSAQFMSTRRNWDLNATTTDINQAKRDSTVISDLKIHESNIWQSFTGGVGLQTRLNSKSEIDLSADYLYYNNDNPSTYDNKLFIEQANKIDASKIDLAKSTPIQFWIAKADYRFAPTPSFSMEAGIKGVTSRLTNDVVVQRLMNDIRTVDNVFSSNSNLHEQIGAAYVSGKWLASSQWQVNTGLRYEYTHTSIRTPEGIELVRRRYGYFFPSIAIKKELNADKDVQFSYSRRITRPTYNDIAPYVFFWGINTFSAGNTSLFPSVSDAVKADYRVGAYSVSLQYTRSAREITSYQPEKASQTGGLTYRSQNLKYADVIALTNSYSVNPTPWWELQGSVTVMHQLIQTSHLDINVKVDIYGANLNAINVFRLPKDFAIEISGFYQSTLLSGTAKYLPQGSLNAGIIKKMGDKGILQLAMDDILNTNYWRIVSDLPQSNINTLFKYNFHNQFVRLTYTRNLGNNKLRSVKLKSASDEERGRVRN